MRLRIRSRICSDLRDLLLACLRCPLTRVSCESIRLSVQQVSQTPPHPRGGWICSRSAFLNPFLVVRAFLLQVTGAYTKEKFIKRIQECVTELKGQLQSCYRNKLKSEAGTGARILASSLISLFSSSLLHSSFSGDWPPLLLSSSCRKHGQQQLRNPKKDSLSFPQLLGRNSDRLNLVECSSRG